ncbi:MAG: response regulator [Oligoflexales bacterium]
MKNTIYKIMIIDDDDDTRDILSKHLSELYPQKLDIHTEDNGIDGLRILAEKKFDFILTDFLMPSMNGMEIITDIRTGSTCNQATPILCITGHLPMIDDKIPAHILTNTDFLEKPYQLEEFKSLTRQYLF